MILAKRWGWRRYAYGTEESPPWWILPLVAALGPLVWMFDVVDQVCFPGQAEQWVARRSPRGAGAGGKERRE